MIDNVVIEELLNELTVATDEDRIASESDVEKWNDVDKTEGLITDDIIVDWDEIKCDIDENSDEENTIVDETNSEVLIDVNIAESGEDWDETTRDVVEIIWDLYDQIVRDEIRDSEDQCAVDVVIVVIDNEGWVVVHNEVNDVVIALDNVVMSNEDMIEEL